MTDQPAKSPGAPPNRLTNFGRVIFWNVIILLGCAVVLELIIGSWFTAPRL